MNNKTFVRVADQKTVSAYLKEARRVKYTVNKNELTFSVKDAEALVFKGVLVRRGLWALTFSENYFVNPHPLPETPAHAGV